MSRLKREILRLGTYSFVVGTLALGLAGWALSPRGPINIESPAGFFYTTAKRGDSYTKIAKRVKRDCWGRMDEIKTKDLAGYILRINELPSLRGDFLDLFNYDFYFGKAQTKRIGDRLKIPVYCQN